MNCLSLFQNMFVFKNDNLDLKLVRAGTVDHYFKTYLCLKKETEI